MQILYGAAMKLAYIDKAGWLIRILLLQLVAAVNIYADVIYLKNGNILLVDKAWEEGAEVKYQTKKGTESIPKSSVETIEKQDPIPPPTAQRWSIAVDKANRSQPGTSAPTPIISTMPGSMPVSKETLEQLRNNLKADPSDAIAKAELVHALNSVASLQVSQGALASARNSLEEALQLDKNNPALLSNLATVYFRLGNYQKAEELLLEYLKGDRKNQWIFYLLGETYYEQENISQAISEWNEALQLGPNETIAKRLEKAKRESGVHSELGSMKSQHFILRYDKQASNYQLGDQILVKLEALYLHLSNELTSHAPETVAVILYPDKAYFNITRAPGWSGGIFDGKIRIPINGLYSITPELEKTLVHELTHSFLAALPGRGSPTWFLEGIAQVQEGRSAANHKKDLEQMQKANRLIPLKDLRGPFTRLPDGMVDTAYIESLSAAEYLIARFGPSAIRSLLDLLAQNYNFENAFNTAMQRSLTEFEAVWQQNLAR
jgi:tetratricopeptide (TPR) repeat protein